MTKVQFSFSIQNTDLIRGLVVVKINVAEMMLEK